MLEALRLARTVVKVGRWRESHAPPGNMVDESQTGRLCDEQNERAAIRMVCSQPGDLEHRHHVLKCHYRLASAIVLRAGYLMDALRVVARH